ncbi:MAG TPA: hypothetical protein ENF77_04630 [Candidatus Acetothermia bacterium]|nr:hypothetical protein [Candidatus Acetothermia bacterium]
MRRWMGVSLSLLPLLFLLYGCTLLQERPLTVNGYWQGGIQVGAEEASRSVQLHLLQNGTDVTGWVKFISGYSFSIWPITSGTFDPEGRTLSIEATNPEDQGEVYSFVGTVSRYSMSGEGTYTDGDREEGFTWSVQRGEGYADLNGPWEGEISGGDFEADLQLDLAQTVKRLEGWINVKTESTMVVLTISSGEVDQEKKLVTIIARGTPSPAKEESYTFTGTLLLINGEWKRMLGTCHFSSNGTEEDLIWSATKVSKGQEIE